MICETCFIRPAVRAVTANVMGAKREYRVCENCRVRLQKIEHKYSNTPLAERSLTPDEDGAS